jgi:hypothetical protein
LTGYPGDHVPSIGPCNSGIKVIDMDRVVTDPRDYGRSAMHRRHPNPGDDHPLACSRKDFFARPKCSATTRNSSSMRWALACSTPPRQMPGRKPTCGPYRKCLPNWARSNPDQLKVGKTHPESWPEKRVPGRLVLQRRSASGHWPVSCIGTIIDPDTALRGRPPIYCTLAARNLCGHNN